MGGVATRWRLPLWADDITKMRTARHSVASSSDRNASISCRCGYVTLTFATRQPVHAFECCCVDCYEKNLWSCRAGGVCPPAGLEAHGVGEPLDLRYFPNRLTVSGKEKLSFNRLREGAASTNMVASCCQTLLCVEHPAYGGNVVLVFPQFTPLADAGELSPPLLRVHIRDWPADAYAQLPPRPGVWRDPATQERRGSSPEALELMSRLLAAFTTPPSAALAGETFQALLAACAGGWVEVLDLPESVRSHRLQGGGSALRRGS